MEAPRTASDPADVPTAAVVPTGRRLTVWILPLVALVFSVLLGYRTMAARGLRVTVRAAEGHGLRGGDPLRYRGISVGIIEDMELSADLSEVLMSVRLSPGSESIARAGSRFWVVRPQLSFDSVQGLETVVGTHYLAVLPGPDGGERREEFVALEEPPIGERIEPGGLEIQLEAPSRFSLSPGAPLTYREIRIGTLLSVGLSSDATSVECRAYVRPAFARLIRENTVFWETGGIEVDLALMGGLRVEVQSLRSLFVGGVALATPTVPGPHVNTGHRFELLADAPEGWRAWQPALPIGSHMLPEDAPLPAPLRAELSWRADGILERQKSRQGWLLATDEGLLAPADLFFPDESVVEGSVVLEVAGQKIAMEPPSRTQRGHLARVEVPLPVADPWPCARLRSSAEREDCLVVADASRPMALAASRLTPTPDGWLVDGALALDEQWHGAAVVARVDGNLIGVLLFEKGEARIERLPADWAAE